MIKQMEWQDRIREYLLDNYKANANKEKIKFLEIDFGELLRVDVEFAHSFFEEPSKVTEEIQDIINSFREVPGKLKVHFSNINAEKIRLSEVKGEHLDKIFKIVGVVQVKGNNFHRVVDHIYQCKRCKRTNSFPEAKCKGCGGDFITKDICETCVELLLEEDMDKLSPEQRPISMRTYVPEYLIDQLSNVYHGSKIKIDALIQSKKKTKNKGEYFFYLEVKHIEILKDGFEIINLNKDIREKIHNNVTNPEYVNGMIQSIFWDVYGLDLLKEAVFLQLIGSPKEIYGNEIRNRGNIHVLFVGSPGVSKSVILKRIASIFPKSRYVSCGNATGIGITASMRKDEDSGGYIVEAGAMVLCHKGGVFCCDEMDKLPKEHHGHLNTAMDSNRIYLDKADVHVQLPCDVSVLAAMNPKNKFFDENESIYNQITLNKDLLDRFDIIIAVHSSKNDEQSKKIAQTILTKRQEKVPVNNQEEVLQFIALAREINPVMTEEARDYITNEFLKLTKNSYQSEGVRYSSRLIQNIARLSGAYARLRLSETINTADAQKAINLLIKSLKSMNMIKEVNGLAYIEETMTENVIPKSMHEKVKAVEKIIFSLNGSAKFVSISEIQGLCTFPIQEPIDYMKKTCLIFNSNEDKLMYVKRE